MKVSTCVCDGIITIAFILILVYLNSKKVINALLYPFYQLPSI
ncbi:MAG: hypothetical protein UZ01_02688 [Candidatus Brocadia sinica]|nr:MAG: hypothetical protein UZ01_02688 [Candidatus Brocadia sinica]